MPNLPINARRRMETNTHWLSDSARAAGDERAQMNPRDLGPDGSGSSKDTARGSETQDHDVSVSDTGLNITAVDDGAFYDQFEKIDRLKRGNRDTMSNEGCHAPPPTSNEIESCSASEEEDGEVLSQGQLDTMVEELRAQTRELRARIRDLKAQMKALDGDLNRLSKESPEAFDKMMSQHGEQIQDLRQRILEMEHRCNSITWADDVREGQVYGDSDGMDDEAESRE